MLYLLQSILTAAARVIFHLRSAHHITDALTTLVWLHVPQRIECKTALLTFRVLHESAPPYLGPLPGRRSLRSTSTNRLLVPPVKRSTVGCRTFPVADTKTWDDLILTAS